MTCGYLIHAYNNEVVDYGTMALCSCLLIKKHLKINQTAIVTSTDTLDYILKLHGEDLLDAAFDNVILTDVDRVVPNRTFYDTRYSQKVVPYYNTNRSDSFDKSPFDETMLLDADYLVLDSSFDRVWGSTEDIMVNRSVRDLNHITNLGGFDKRFNSMSIPLYWATAVYFKKNHHVKSIFNLIKFIKKNYVYYQNLYRFPPSGYFRNDYALSIAIHMINGQFENAAVKSLPMPEMLVATEYDNIIDFKDGIAYMTSEANQGEFKLHKVNTNVHVMNKWSIGRMSSRIIQYATS